MNHTEIRNEVRRRVVLATSINPLTELKAEGNTFDNGQKSFWVEEYLIGGDLSNMTNRRNGSSAYLIQYDLCCPPGSSMDIPESKAALIESALIDAQFTVSGSSVFCKGIKSSRNQGKLRNVVSVLLTFEIQSF